MLSNAVFISIVGGVLFFNLIFIAISITFTLWNDRKVPHDIPVEPNVLQMELDRKLSAAARPSLAPSLPQVIMYNAIRTSITGGIKFSQT